MVKTAPIPLSTLIDVVGGAVLSGNTDGHFSEIGEPLEVGSDGVAFVISEAFLKDVPQTKAGVLVVQEAMAEKVLSQLPNTVRLCVTSKDAYVGLAQLSKVIAESDPCFDWPASSADADSPRVHPTAKVDSTAKIAPGAVIGEGAVVGARTSVLPNAVVGPRVQLGEDCVLFPGVVLYPRTIIGNRVRIHANAVLGSDGFGYARGAQGSVKIWHLGKVVVGDDVEIGAGSMIDRGTMKDTVIERGAKIDNLVQIGHNGWVKAHAILCAQVGLAGNVTIGRGAILAGKVGVADKLDIGDGALVGPLSGLSKDVEPREQVMGVIPARSRREWWRMVALIDRLPSLFERVKKLEGKSQ